MDCDGDSLLTGYQHQLGPSGHRWNTTDSTIGKNDLWIAAHAKAAYLCSFLALVLRKELDRCLERTGEGFESSEIKQDLKALQSVTICESGKRFAVSSQSQGFVARCFKLSGMRCRPQSENYESPEKAEQ